MKQSKKRIGLYILFFICILTSALLIMVQFSQNTIVESVLKQEEKPTGNGYEETNAENDNTGLKPDYNPDNVEPLNVLNVLKYKRHENKAISKGRLIIPDVGIDLKIYEGLNNVHLVLGAAEQRPRSEVVAGGVGNYILAAHSSLHSDDEDFLFTPLRKVKAGNIILVTDKYNLYVYEAEYGKIFDRDATEPLNEDFNDARITLYTCLSREQFSLGRFVVRGLLKDTIKLENVMDSEYGKYF